MWKKYFVDIVCIWETIKNGLNSENLTCFSTKEDVYGLGFIISEKWKNNIHKYWKENDGIAIL